MMQASVVQSWGAFGVVLDRLRPDSVRDRFKRSDEMCHLCICQFKTLNMAAISSLSHKSEVVLDLANLSIELNPLDGDDFSEVT